MFLADSRNGSSLFAPGDALLFPLSVDLPLQSETHCGMFDEANAHRLLFDGAAGSIRKLRYLLAGVYVHAAANLSVCNECYAFGGTHPAVRVFTYQSDGLSHPRAIPREPGRPSYLENRFRHSWCIVIASNIENLPSVFRSTSQLKSRSSNEFIGKFRKLSTRVSIK